MGLIRSGVIVTLSTLLFISLFLSNAFLTLNWSLEHDNVINNSQNFSNTLSKQNLTIDDIYYKEYNCSLFECIKQDESPLVLLSEKSKIYFHQKFIFMLLISLALIGIMFLFLESKYSVFTITGILMIFSALPFRKLNWAINLLPKGKVTELFIVFFTKATNVFTVMLIIGGILLALGIAFEFLGIGLKLNNFLNKFRKEQKEDLQKEEINSEKEEQISKTDVQKMVKEEIKKQKKKEEVQKNIKKIVKQELNKK